jgi:hypothetical protein
MLSWSTTEAGSAGILLAVSAKVFFVLLIFDLVCKGCFAASPPDVRKGFAFPARPVRFSLRPRLKEIGGVAPERKLKAYRKVIDFPHIGVAEPQR